MKPIIALTVAVLIAGCANTIRPQHVTKDEISLQYDTVLNSLETATARADEHCAQFGKKAELISQWDNIGTRGATFRCVES